MIVFKCWLSYRGLRTTSGAFALRLFVWCESWPLLCYATSCRNLPPAPCGWLSINRINWATATTNEMVQKYTIGFLMLAPAWRMHWLRRAQLLWLLLFLWSNDTLMIELNYQRNQTSIRHSRGDIFQVSCHATSVWLHYILKVHVTPCSCEGGSCLSSLPLIGY